MKNPLPNTAVMPSEPERIQKYLARCGVDSRRKCEVIIASGRVTVNGDMADVGQKVSDADEIRLDGDIISPLTKEYYVVNKPMGYICSNAKEKGMRRAIDLIPNAEKKGLFNVGRLDVGTSGILILTNDGDFANRVIHPSMGWEKEYIVHIKGHLNDWARTRLEKGVDIGEKKMASGKVIKTKQTKEGTKVWAVIHEGRTHIIKRMFESLDYKVISLVRIRIGPLTLGKLGPGDYTKLAKSRVDELFPET